MSRSYYQMIELAVEPHESEIVISSGSPLHSLSNAQELRLLLLVGALSSRPAQQPFELAANFEHEELVAGVDVRYQNPFPRQNRDQPFDREPLQRLANRRSTDADRR